MRDDLDNGVRRGFGQRVDSVYVGDPREAARIFRGEPVSRGGKTVGREPRIINISHPGGKPVLDTRS